MRKSARETEKALRVGAVVARRVKELRKSRGLTQADVADRLTGLDFALDQTAVAKIEGGRRRVTVEELLALAIVLGVSPLALLLPESDAEHIQLMPWAAHSALTVRQWLMFQTPLLITNTEDEQQGAEDAYLRARPEVVRRSEVHYPEVSAVTAKAIAAREAVGKSGDDMTAATYLAVIRAETDAACASIAARLDDKQRKALHWDRTGRQVIHGKGS